MFKNVNSYHTKATVHSHQCEGMMVMSILIWPLFSDCVLHFAYGSHLTVVHCFLLEPAKFIRCSIELHF